MWCEFRFQTHSVNRQISAQYCVALHPHFLLFLPIPPSYSKLCDILDMCECKKSSHISCTSCGQEVKIFPSFLSKLTALDFTLMLTSPDIDYSVIAHKKTEWALGPKDRDLKENHIHVKGGRQVWIAAKDATTLPHESWKTNWNCGGENKERQMDKKKRLHWGL